MKIRKQTITYMLSATYENLFPLKIAIIIYEFTRF